MPARLIKNNIFTSWEKHYTKQHFQFNAARRSHGSELNWKKKYGMIQTGSQLNNYFIPSKQNEEADSLPEGGGALV